MAGVDKKKPTKSYPPDRCRGHAAPRMRERFADSTFADWQVDQVPMMTVVQPAGPPQPLATHQRQCGKSISRVLAVIYCWFLWLFVVILIFGQHYSATNTSMYHLRFGQSPDEGLYQAESKNDEPYTDRSFVCSLHGRVYKPLSVQKAIKAPFAVVEDTTGMGINGYRMVPRDQFEFSPEAHKAYVGVCNFVAAKVDTIVEVCTKLGYNVMVDKLRIVPGGDNSTMIALANTLPVIVLPYYDNSLNSRFAMPGSDGSACVFRLVDSPQGEANSILHGVSRLARETTAIALLGRPGGVWKNGWYEDLQGARWHSDVVTFNLTPTLGVPTRELHLLTNQEYDCSKSATDCEASSITSVWGPLRVTEKEAAFTSITVSNGFSYGLFLYDGDIKRVVESNYDLRFLISNISLAWLLLRWMVAMVAMLNGYRHGVSELDAAGLGVLSCARGFHLLPVVLLPRLKLYLAVFCTIGCQFEGAQRALGESTTLMYSSMAEYVLFSYSILNLLAKALHRRVSDALFGPALLFYCLLHRYRRELAESGWMEYQGRVTTVVTSSEFDALSILDFFQYDVALRFNGNVKSLLLIKVAVHAATVLLPLLWSKHQQLITDDSQLTLLERALGLRLDASGGLASVPFRTCASGKISGATSATKTRSMSGYELVRLGYVVFGGDCLISIYDWYSILLMSPARLLWSPISPGHLLVFHATRDLRNGCYEVKSKPKLCRMHDEQLLKHHCWQIYVGSFH